MVKIKSKKQSLSCYVVGEESLAIQCIEILIKNHFSIVGFITSNPQLIEWATKHNIKIIPSDINLDKILTRKVDFLFSIVNPFILTNKLLKKVKKLAINYHDSLLPRYAGVHATSWALINQEKIHGITWHLIENKIDTGDILKQILFNIDKGETALSLNLKCFQAALSSFNELVKELITNTYQRKPQDLSQRTYYSYNQKPVANGWVNWKDSARNIERLFRALKFGNYSNRLCVLKFVTNNELYIIDELKISNRESNKLPGKIIKLTKNELSIATKTKDIVVTRLRTASNKIIEFSSVNKQLKVGNRIYSPVRELQNIYQQFASMACKHEQYWLKQLLQCDTTILPFLDSSEKGNESKAYACLTYYKLSKSMQKEINTRLNNHINKQIVLLTVLIVYLHRINNQELLSIDFSCPLLQQEKSKLSCLISKFVPFNIRLQDNLTFKKCLELVNNKVLNIENHGAFLNDVYVRYLELDKYNKRSIAIILNNTIKNKLSSLHPINLVITEDSISFYINKKVINENLRIFLDTTIGHLNTIFENFVFKPKPINQFSLLTNAEKKKILIEWNQTKTKYPRHKPITQLFQEQVGKKPHHIAIVYNNQQMTYLLLNEKSSQLAYYLRKQGVRSGQLVAICIEKSFEMIIAILGVLKAGGAYVPIDPNLPKPRIKFILEDINAKVIVTQKKFFNYFSKGNLVLININQSFTHTENKIESSLFNYNKPTDLAYVIYTSGSTGKPKGVLVEQRGVVNMVFAKIKQLSITHRDKLLNFSTFSFDASVWEIFTSLLAGATLFIARREDILPGATLSNFLRKNKITIATLPPSVLMVTLSSHLPDLRVIISAGEKCIDNIVNKWNKNRFFINAYGPTEATVCATMAVCKKDIAVTIGNPISNVKAYVVDNYNQLLPVGVEGELLIGGDCVARGYLNNQDLTKEKFILAPFMRSKVRLYKTGDMVCWLPDGNLKYIGRKDDQIKIRGFRVELGEIESALNKHSQVEQAVACVHETDNRMQIEVYWITKKQAKISFDQLQNYLKNILPAYMVPTKFMEVTSFPLTLNNKIDKKALIEKYYNIRSLSTPSVGTPPISDIESLLIKIWKTILKVNDITITDNFFTLGGDSITAIQVVAKFSNYGMSITVKDIFQFPTIVALAKRATKQHHGNSLKLITGQKFSLAPIQQWFFEQNFKNKEQFSQICFLTVKLPLDVQILEQCFQNIVKKYDSLNLRFKYFNNTWQQYYVNFNKKKIVNVIDSSSYKSELNKFAEQWAEKLQESFDLERGPILKVAVLLGHSLELAKLIIAIHHLAIDGVSWRILLGELETQYHSLISQSLSKENNFKSTSYQDWIKSLSNTGLISNSEKEFWRQMNKDFLLPIDYKRGPNLEKYACSVTIALNENETNQLIQILPKLYAVSSHEILISLLVRVLNNWKKTNEIVIDVESHGRVEFSNSINLSKTLGWFTSVYPVCFNNIPSALGELIYTIKKQLQSVHGRSINYGLLSYFKNEILPFRREIAFNYWGQFQQGSKDNIFLLDELKLVSHPNNKRTHLINVDAVVKGKKLKITWFYSINYHKSTTIKYLVQSYLSDLRTLLNEHHKILSVISTLPLHKSVLPMKVPIYSGLNNHENIEHIYPLSPLQKGLLFHAVFTPISGNYVIQLVWRSQKNSLLDLDGLYQAWQMLIQRHSVLRTFFIWDNTIEPVQAVQKAVNLTWNVYDWTTADEQFVEDERLNTFLKADRQAGFELNKAPLLRVTIIKLPQQRYYMIITLHHILLDGWSLPILLNELDVLYHTIKNNLKTSLSSPVLYSHYLKWQQEQNLAAAEKFWKGYLQGFLAPTDLPIIDKHTNVTIEDDFIDIAFDQITLSTEFSKLIHQFCRQQGLTLNTLFQGAWALILNHYSQDDDILFGVTLTERTPAISHSDKIIGLLINTLPLRIVLNNKSVHDYLMGIQEAFARVAYYHYTPLPEIQKWSEVSSGAPLFNTILIFENYPITNHKNQLIKFEEVEIIDPTHYPLACIILPGKNIKIKLAYDKTKIQLSAIKRLQEHLQTILMTLIDNPQQSIYPLNILTSNERQQILIDWNKTKITYPHKKVVHQLFEEQVEKTPDKIAIMFENQSLTYRELNKLANQLANYLCAKGIQSEDLVAICVERSLEVVIAILGILKAGGAYVPIDPYYPKERIHYILKDSNASLLLTQKNICQSHELNLCNGKIIFLEDKQNISNFSSENLNKKIKASNLCYAIFTSGSTGKPKEVLIEHRAVVNFLNAMRLHIKPASDDHFLAVTSISFDISALEFYLPLMIGAKCIIASHAVVTDGKMLKDYITQSICCLTLYYFLLIQISHGSIANRHSQVCHFI